MWKVLLKILPIWFFDATGSIIKNIPNQKTSYLYSIVMHDFIKNKIIPFSEFVSTEHSTISISHKLFYIKKSIDSYSTSDNFMQPKVIVVDFSWALLNSILDVFCNHKIGSYLTYCFQKLVMISNTKELYTIPYICSTHFLRMMFRRAKSLNNCDKNMVNIFIYVFTLLQNARSLNEFNDFICLAFKIFKTKTNQSFVSSSVSQINYELETRDYHLDKILTDEVTEDRKDDEDISFKEKELIQFEDVSNKESLKEKSPFTTYFNSLIWIMIKRF
jgi:hypothetical protein